MAFFFEHLASAHNRAKFECGVLSLDSYIKTQAGQDMRRDLSSVHVLTDNGTNIIGFYTLSQCAAEAEDFRENSAKKLPTKRIIPCSLLGRLAVDRNYKGCRFGRVLLFDAMKRVVAVSRDISSYALIVDAKDERAKEFYIKYGFKEFKDAPLRLFIPTHVMRTECA